MKKRIVAITLTMVLLLCMACVPALADGKETSPVLPDIGAFLGNVSPAEEGSAKYAGLTRLYKLSIDEGWQAGTEYVQLLLNDPRYQFELTNSFNQTVLAMYKEYYFFDYVGEKEIAPAKAEYYTDDYHTFTGDMYILLQRHADKGITYIRICYSSDLVMQDNGDRSSIVPKGAKGSSGTGISHDGPYIPDFAKQDCLTCNGDGDCTNCGGDGTIKVYNGNGNYIDSPCHKCHQSGNCTRCGGSGTRD